MSGGTFITEQKRQRSNFEQKYLDIYGNQQERRIDLPGLSPAVIQKKQELEQMQQRLADERVNYERWAKDYQNRKSEIEESRATIAEEANLHATFNRHTQEEIDKIKEATSHEYDLTIKYTRKLNELKEKESELESRLTSLRQRIEKLQPAADFVERVVSQTKVFETPDAIVQRYDVLMAAKSDWGDELGRNLRSTDEFVCPRARLNHLKNILIEKNHKMAAMRDELQRVHQEGRYNHIGVIKNAERLNEKEEEEATIKTSIENICRQILLAQEANKKKAQREMPESIEDRLDIIKQRFLDLQATINDPEAVRLSPAEILARQKLRSPSKQMELSSTGVSPKISSCVSTVHTPNKALRDPSSPSRILL